MIQTFKRFAQIPQIADADSADIIPLTGKAGYTVQRYTVHDNGCSNREPYTVRWDEVHTSFLLSRQVPTCHVPEMESQGIDRTRWNLVRTGEYTTYPLDCFATAHNDGARGTSRSSCESCENPGSDKEIN
jgi:hypothetical protein